MGVAIPDMPTCGECSKRMAVVLCEDDVWRCIYCCSEDGFDSISGEVYDYDWDWSSDDEEEDA